MQVVDAIETGVPSLDVGWDGHELHEDWAMYYTTGRKWQHHCVSVCSTLHIGYFITTDFSYRTWGGTASVLHMWLPPQVRFQSNGSLLPTNYFIIDGPP